MNRAIITVHAAPDASCVPAIRNLSADDITVVVTQHPPHMFGPDTHVVAMDDAVVAIVIREDDISHITNDDLWARLAHEAMDFRERVIASVEAVCVRS